MAQIEPLVHDTRHLYIAQLNQSDPTILTMFSFRDTIPKHISQRCMHLTKDGTWTVVLFSLTEMHGKCIFDNHKAPPASLVKMPHMYVFKSGQMTSPDIHNHVVMEGMKSRLAWLKQVITGRQCVITASFRGQQVRGYAPHSPDTEENVIVPFFLYAKADLVKNYSLRMRLMQRSILCGLLLGPVMKPGDMLGKKVLPITLPEGNVCVFLCASRDEFEQEAKEHVQASQNGLSYLEDPQVQSERCAKEREALKRECDQIEKERKDMETEYLEKKSAHARSLKQARDTKKEMNEAHEKMVAMDKKKAERLEQIKRHDGETYRNIMENDPRPYSNLPMISGMLGMRQTTYTISLNVNRDTRVKTKIYVYFNKEQKTPLKETIKIPVGNRLETLIKNQTKPGMYTITTDTELEKIKKGVYYWCRLYGVEEPRFFS